MNTAEFQPVVHEFSIDGTQDKIEDFLVNLSLLKDLLFLDSCGSGPGNESSFSYLAADPVDQIEIGRNDDFDFEQVRRIWKRYRSSSLDSLPPFQGGLAGFLSYELNTKLEQIEPAEFDEFKLPLLKLNVYDVVVSFDHHRQKGWIVSHGWPEDDPESRQQRAQERSSFFRELLFESETNLETICRPTGPLVIPEAPLYRLDESLELYSDFSREEFLQMIETAVSYIHQGDVFQCNLSQRLMTPAICSSLSLYLQLRHSNPAPFSCFFNIGDGEIISTSPERLVRLQDGRIETRPIKGTRRRTGYPEVDLTVSQELADSEKDRAENIMIVDLMRNDLSKVAEDDSVLVEKLCGIESYEKVLHLVSVVTGQLLDRCDCIELLEAVFPGGSITGAPKIRAMEIIAELEPTVRGAYCGSLGFIDHLGNMDFNILIRTITAKGGWWQIPVGGGIVSDSEPLAEYEETWTKAIAMLNAIVKNQNQNAVASD